MNVETDKIIEIAHEAGAAIMEIYNREDVGVETKEDDSPITHADLAANKIITARLRETYPDIPIISEESAQTPYEERKNWEYFWLVDPIDGTKEFIKKNGEFGVNIALIHRDTPVLGVIYAPAKDLLYYADENGAWKIENGEQTDIEVSEPGDTLIVLGSRSHPSPEMQGFLEEQHKVFENVDVGSLGSSLKFCAVAEGSAHMVPRFGNLHEWDTAAGHAILVAAGGSYTEIETGKPVRYNTPDLKHPWTMISWRS